jgi:hypothetical protein
VVLRRGQHSKWNPDLIDDLRRSHELQMRERRQCEASLERFQRRGLSFHPVRAALPWRMPEAQDDVSR